MNCLASCKPIFRRRSQTQTRQLLVHWWLAHFTWDTQDTGKSTSKEIHLRPGVFFPPKSMEILPKIPPASPLVAPQPGLRASASASRVLKREAGSAAGAELHKGEMLFPSLNFSVS